MKPNDTMYFYWMFAYFESI